MTAETNGQPTVCIEGSRSFDYAPNNSRQSAADLLRSYAFRQLPAQRHLRKQLEWAKTVSERSPDRGKARHLALHSGTEIRPQDFEDVV
jgi:hypothetical protein